VLQLDPGNAEATEGLKRLGGLLIARARTALDERRFDNALAELEAARSIDPNDQRLVEVDARLDSMRAQTALAQIQATLAAQNFDRAQSLLEAAQKDALLPPAQIAQLSKDLDSKRRSVTSPPGRRAEARLPAAARDAAAIREGRDPGPARRGRFADLVTRLNNDLNQRCSPRRVTRRQGRPGAHDVHSWLLPAKTASRRPSSTPRSVTSRRRRRSSSARTMTSRALPRRPRIASRAAT
jgi:tetratricopeptide (TPR) repeat protein